MELNDLDWADRETVLRLLFSKMNTGESAGCWREATSGSQPTKSRGSKTTEEGGRSSNKQDLNRGFREEADYDAEHQEET